MGSGARISEQACRTQTLSRGWKSERHIGMSRAKVALPAVSKSAQPIAAQPWRSGWKVSMRNHPLRRPRSTLLALALSCLGFLVPATSQASDVQFDAVITVAGEETIGFEDRTFSQDFPRFEVQGGALGGKPRRTETHTLCVPAELAMTCALDTSRTHSTDTGWEGGYGQGKPGFGVFVTSMNSPGGAQSASYTLTDPVRMLVGELCLTATVTVRAERLQRGWYEGRQEIYLRCPVRRAWSRTQVIEGIKLSSVDGYTQVGAYTGPLGSPAGVRRG